MQNIEVGSARPLCDGDYRHALIHLAWYREDRQRTLLFGMVELFPAEMPAPDSSEEMGQPLRAIGRQHWVYIRRFAMPVSDALNWYEECRKGRVRIPGEEEKELVVNAFGQEPPWPHLLTTQKLPFHAWGSVRAHHLVQAAPPPAAKLPMTTEIAAKWLAERLYFDMIKFGEWLGSVSLVAPNPVLRAIHHTLAVDEQGEASDIHLITRSGFRVNGLVVHLGEHRHGGIAGFRTINVEQPYLRIRHVGRTEDVSLAVVCQRRGVLEWQDPTGFLRTLAFSMSVNEGVQTVKVPDSPGRTGEEYRRHLHVRTSDTLFGEVAGERSIAAVLRGAALARESANEAQRRGQKLFYDDPDGARDFIRGIIGRAQVKVWIVDPYFATKELFAFALATSFANVEVRIITSAEYLKKRDNVDKTREAGEVLFSQMKALKDHGRFEIFVMPGARSPIHDRFLVIDETVWHSGNSLHSIGERASLLIKLPAPVPIIALIENVTKIPLKNWLSIRHKARGKGKKR